MEESIIIINMPKTSTQPAITITGEFISANHNSKNHSYHFTISDVVPNIEIPNSSEAGNSSISVVINNSEPIPVTFWKITENDGTYILKTYSNNIDKSKDK